MSRTAVRRRPEQVAELTSGLALPLPPINTQALLTISETLARAWNDLSAKHPETLRRGGEAEVNALLETRLNALLDEDLCWQTLVSGISRGRETISFDGRHLEKKPDLSIHLTCRNFSFPLVAECKLIDRPAEKTVGLYCTKGLARFIRGDYAWATREAFMLAYVRDGVRIENCLIPHLDERRRKSPDPYLTQELSALPRPAVPDLVCSRHSRNFAYIHAAPSAIPGWRLRTDFPRATGRAARPHQAAALTFGVGE